MEQEKPKSIKNIGLVISILSGILILNYLGGVFVFTFLGFGKPSETHTLEKTFVDVLFENYVLICLVMIVIGFLYLIGGLNLRKYKLWANKLLSILSIFSLILFCILFAAIYKFIPQELMPEIIFPLIFIILFITAPLILLVLFLNMKKIKRHFD